jgi:hypothetical protein
MAWYSQDERKALNDHFTASGRTEVTEAEVKEFIKEFKAAARRCRKAAGPVVRSNTCYKWRNDPDHWRLEQVPQHDKIAARDLGLKRWAEAQAAEPLGHLLDMIGLNYDNASISLTYSEMSRIIVGQGDGVPITESPDRLARVAARRKRARIRALRRQIPALQDFIRSKEADLLEYKTELEELTADVQN